MKRIIIEFDDDEDFQEIKPTKKPKQVTQKRVKGTCVSDNVRKSESQRAIKKENASSKAKRTQKPSSSSSRQTTLTGGVKGKLRETKETQKTADSTKEAFDIYEIPIEDRQNKSGRIASNKPESTARNFSSKADDSQTVHIAHDNEQSVNNLNSSSSELFFESAPEPTIDLSKAESFSKKVTCSENIPLSQSSKVSVSLEVLKVDQAPEFSLGSKVTSASSACIVDLSMQDELSSLCSTLPDSELNSQEIHATDRESAPSTGSSQQSTKDVPQNTQGRTLGTSTQGKSRTLSRKGSPRKGQSIQKGKKAPGWQMTLSAFMKTSGPEGRSTKIQGKMEEDSGLGGEVEEEKTDETDKFQTSEKIVESGYVPEAHQNREIHKQQKANFLSKFAQARTGKKKARQVDQTVVGPEIVFEPESTATRRCPFYKKITGTTFTVDAFSYGVVPGITSYFLSHFHYDHYRGLTKNFKQPIYCSSVTANLVLSSIRVGQQYIHRLPMNEPVMVENVKVTLLDANHCPGAVLFLFELPDGTVHLHTGDFRACTEMESYPELFSTTVSNLYLDTTYLEPQYCFPHQQAVLDLAVNLAVEFMAAHPRGLIVVGAYTIGKERVFLAVAQALGTSVYVTAAKRRTLKCLEDPVIDGLLAAKPEQARVHVLPMGALKKTSLEEYIKSMPGRDSVLALSPTGWTHRRNVALADIRPSVATDKVTIYGLPYSEHSSFDELRSFVRFVQPKRIIPTVNVGRASTRQRMQNHLSSWQHESADID